MLLGECAGRKITFKELYRNHSVGKPYTDSNYRQVLKDLEEANLIVAEKPGKRRRRGTFPDDVVITFPKKGV